MKKPPKKLPVIRGRKFAEHAGLNHILDEMVDIETYL
jgi:hypothetical protein